MPRPWPLALALLACATAPPRAPMSARDWYEAGKRQYQAGSYEQALEAFENAYMQKPDPVLLFDIAQANRRLGHYDEAVENYRNYLKAAKGERRQAVEELIADTRREQRRARGAAAGP